MDSQSDFCQGIGIDLVQATKNELAFLEGVVGYPNLCSGPVVREAIRRYELLWLPLASRHLLDSQAPLDIAWVWHVHMLAPYYYEQDCLNILGKMLDHSPLDVSFQRQKDLQNARSIDLWREAYPAEPFEIDLVKPPTIETNYQSKIQCNLEEACSRQFKFFYQVSLPHYKDDLFLKKAVERYEHHLRLISSHGHDGMVHCYDIELIWHAHQLHPLKYNQTTTELFGKPLHHEDTETATTPVTPYDSEMKTATVWEEEGLRFARPGAMYRGEPPDPMPAKPKWLYTALSFGEFSCEIQSIEALALNLESKKNYIVRFEDLLGKKTHFAQSFKGTKRTSNPRPRKFTFESGKESDVYVCLYTKDLFTEKQVAARKRLLDLLPLLGTISFVDDSVASRKRVTLDVPFCMFTGGTSVAKVAMEIEFQTIVKYNFEVESGTGFTQDMHPERVISSPALMLSPSDLAKPMVPCGFATHSILGCGGSKVFSCRVVHSSASAALLSAAEVIDGSDQVVATTHTIDRNTLPGMDDVEDNKNIIVLNQDEGERAMLVRGNKDWAVCIGKWQKNSEAEAIRSPKGKYFVEIKVYKLFGECGWCSVRRSSDGEVQIDVDSDTTVRIDLMEDKIEISTRTQDIPEVLALAFSVSILNLLCTPEKFLNRDKYSAATPISLYSAGYYCTQVPDNEYIDLRYGRYDFNEFRRVRGRIGY